MELGRRRFGAIVSMLAMSIGIWGCTSPTLPLPPPADPSIAKGSTDGHVLLSSIGGANANAIIVVYNRNPAVSRDDRVSATQADERGSWSVEVVATSGDALDVTQQIDTERSPSITITVPSFP